MNTLDDRYERELMDKINKWTNTNFHIAYVYSTELSPTLEQSIYALGFEEFGNFYQHRETKVILSHLHIDHMLKDCWTKAVAPTVSDLQTFFAGQLLDIFAHNDFEPDTHEESLWEKIFEFDEDIAKELRAAYIVGDEITAETQWIVTEDTIVDADVDKTETEQDIKIRQYFPQIHSVRDFDTSKWEDADLYLTQESDPYTKCCSDLCYLLFDHLVDGSYRSEDAFRTYRGDSTIHIPQSLVTLLQDRIDRDLPIYFSFVPWNMDADSTLNFDSEQTDEDFLDFVLAHVAKAVELMLPNYLDD